MIGPIEGFCIGDCVMGSLVGKIVGKPVGVSGVDGAVVSTDRNGENVQGFPITLNSKITNGLMVVDYDSTRDYRYFVACEDALMSKT